MQGPFVNMQQAPDGRDPRQLLQEAAQDAGPSLSGAESAGTARGPHKRGAHDAGLGADASSKGPSARRQKAARIAKPQPSMTQPLPNASGTLGAYQGMPPLLGDAAPAMTSTAVSMGAGDLGAGMPVFANQKDQLSFLAAIAAQYPSPRVGSELEAQALLEQPGQVQEAASGAAGPLQAAPGQNEAPPDAEGVSASTFMSQAAVQQMPYQVTSGANLVELVAIPMTFRSLSPTWTLISLTSAGKSNWAMGLTT